MGREKDRKQDQKVQREYTARSTPPACKRKCNNCNNRSCALAVTGVRKPVVEETTAGALKLKELVIEGELFSLPST